MNVLELCGIEKIYGNGVVANQQINISFEQSEIHAIVGENGAGKTTLMKMIFGLEQPSKGKILMSGKEVSFHSPLDAVAMGIGMVHQHFMLIPSFTVLENILLGREPHKMGVLKLERERANVEALCKEYQFEINLDEKVENLNVGNKQKVEILKVLYQKADIIILDEPTAVLTPQETEKLFEQLLLLKKRGKTILFISHKLNEVKQLSDRITVLRKGRVISTHKTEEIEAEQISELMIGRRVVYSYEELRHETKKEPILKVEHLTYQNTDGKQTLKDVSFDVCSGEIVGVVGVEGNGQRELVDLLFGYTKPLSGGNIQKVVFAREAYTDGTFLIAEQPTRGVDVGSASLIHKHLLQLRNDGRAVLMISADLGEALAVCDKLLVLYSGEIVAELTDVQNITESEVGLYMLGLKKQERNEKGGSANETR